MVDQRNLSEAKIQQLAITEVRNKYPETSGCLYHVPNGGYRDDREAAILTGQGVVPGIQDLHFLWMGITYLIEVKDHNGKISMDQKVIHAKHKLHGKDTYVFRTSEQIVYFIGYIVQGRSLKAFDRFISEYSVAENLDQYINERRLFKIKKAEEKQNRKRVA